MEKFFRNVSLTDGEWYCVLEENQRTTQWLNFAALLGKIDL